MSRLVDADALIEVIKESRPLNWTDSESELQEDVDYNHFIEMVNAQPTAYDVEKVVAELEEASHWEEPTYDEDGYSNDDSWEVVYSDKAIEIVRKGGAE